MLAIELEYYFDYMASSISDSILIEVRRALNKDNIKLWESPFTVNFQDLSIDGAYSDEFIEKYSNITKLDSLVLVTALEHLRRAALSKSASRMKFQSTGIATIKIKPTSEHLSSDLECSLHITGEELVSMVAAMYGVPIESVKLIHSGRIILGNDLIKNQGIRNLSKIMCICFSEENLLERKRQTDFNDKQNLLEKVKNAATKLSKRTEYNDSNYSLDIQDQNGNIVTLPAQEKQALTSAMALHKKGKSLINCKQFAESLIILCEAESQFSACRSTIIDMVDNYGILCLDICWCYLNLKQIADLHSAEDKMKKCEKTFYKSYGRDLSRLNKLKDKESILEHVLLVRMYLLQAIVSYHKDDIFNAKVKLSKAEQLASSLLVNEDTLMQLVNMGYEVKESRIALRVCNGDITSAIDFIYQKKNEAQIYINKEKKDLKEEKLRQKLGKTENGEQVDVNKYKQLLEMGFPKDYISRALSVLNNDFDNAIQVISSSMYLMNSFTSNSVPFETRDITAYGLSTTSPFSQTNFDELLSQLIILGFDTVKARDLLNKHHCDMNAVANEIQYSFNDFQSSESESLISDTKEEVTEGKSEDKDIIELVSNWEASDDYLDVTLDDELVYLTNYKHLIYAIQSNIA